MPCSCSRDYRHTCQKCFIDKGPTLGPDLPIWQVFAAGEMRRIPAQSQLVAESIARHRTRNGKFDSQYLFNTKN